MRRRDFYNLIFPPLCLPRELKSVRFSDACLLFKPEEGSPGRHQDLPNMNPPERQDEKTIHQRGGEYLSRKLDFYIARSLRFITPESLPRLSYRLFFFFFSRH